jgi:hypothetical protein
LHRLAAASPLERLESRVLLTSRVWDGGALLNDRWTDADNWEGNVAPVAGDDLVVPTRVSLLDRSANNDFPTNTLFGSITIDDDNYRLTGNRIRLSGDITFAAVDNPALVGFFVTAKINLDVQFSAGAHAITVSEVPFVGSSGSQFLELNGHLGDDGGLGSLRIVNGDL